MLRHSLTVSILLFVSYGIVFVGGLLGNGFLLVTLVKKPSIRKTTNIFIGNLAVSDLLVSIFCIPFLLSSNILVEWPFGEIVCKLVAYFQAVATNASVNSLVTISIDRCLSINRPFSCFKTRRKIVIALIAIWCLPITYMAPWLFVFATKTTSGYRKYTICTDFWISKKLSDAYFITVNLCLSYLVPLLVISICYLLIYKKVHTRNIPGEMCANRRQNLNYYLKLRLIKMILTVIIIFAISWLPLYTLFIATKFLDYPHSKEEIKFFQYIFPFAQWLATSNSCINPFIYICYTKKFRKEFDKLLTNMQIICKINVRHNRHTKCITIKESTLFSSSEII